MNIGEEQKEVTFEPVEIPGPVEPVREPSPAPAPVTPVREPEPVGV